MTLAKTYITIKDVAKRFGVNTTTIYRLAQKGKLPGFKVGNQWRFNEDLLKHWEAQQMNQLLMEKEKHSEKEKKGK